MFDNYLESVLNELVDLSDEDRVVIGGALREWYETEPVDELPPAAIAAAELRERLGLPDPVGSVEFYDDGDDSTETVVADLIDVDRSELGEPDEGELEHRPLARPLLVAGLVLILIGMVAGLANWWRADMNIAIEQTELSGLSPNASKVSSGIACSQGEMVISGLIRADSGVVLKDVKVAELAGDGEGTGVVLVDSLVRDRIGGVASSAEGYELAGSSYFNDQIELVYDVSDCEQIARSLGSEPEFVVTYRYLGRDRQLSLTSPIATVQQSGGS